MISFPHFRMDEVRAPPRKGLAKRFGVGSKAPPELIDQPKSSESIRPVITSARSYVARPMFSVPKTKEAVPKTKEAVPKTKEAVPKNKNKQNTSKPSKQPLPKLAEVLEKQEDEDIFGGLTDDLKEMGELIIKGETETENLYDTEVPVGYVPQTRRGFSDFIKSAYAPFELPNGPITIPEGEKYYPYQKFVRDYMRKEAPYRGILVYHGLGSGKTCTAIAASEALFASAKKKIIVMTPFSL